MSLYLILYVSLLGFQKILWEKFGCLRIYYQRIGLVRDSNPRTPASQAPVNR